MVGKGGRVKGDGKRGKGEGLRVEKREELRVVGKGKG